jgi:hypothetical protein
LQFDLPHLLRGQHRSEFRTLAQIEAMLDCVVRNEKNPDVVQISGGGPTLHVTVQVPPADKTLDMVGILLHC